MLIGKRFLLFNGVRLLTVVSLSLVFAATCTTLANDFKHAKTDPVDADGGKTDYIPDTDIPTHTWGALWSSLHHFFTLFLLALCLLSELSWGGFVDRFFRAVLPVLGPDWGISVLGVLMMVLAADGLSRSVGKFPLIVNWLMCSVGLIVLLFGMVFRAPMKRQRSPFAWKDTCTENAEKAASVLPAPVTSKLSEVASAIPRFQPPAQKQPAPEMPPAVPWADQTSARDAPSPLPAAFPFAPPPALPEAVRTRSPVHEPPEHSPGLIASWRAMALEAKVRAQAAARKSLHLGRPGYRLSHLPPGRAETSDRLPQYLDKGDHRAELERKASLSSVHTSSSKGTCSSGKTHAVPYVKYAYV